MERSKLFQNCADDRGRELACVALLEHAGAKAQPCERVEIIVEFAGDLTDLTATSSVSGTRKTATRSPREMNDADRLHVLPIFGGLAFAARPNFAAIGSKSRVLDSRGRREAGRRVYRT